MDLKDGVYCYKASGYEFRGTMPYRVIEGALVFYFPLTLILIIITLTPSVNSLIEGTVLFYLDAVELAPAKKWQSPHGPRGPGGKRLTPDAWGGYNARWEVPDERTPAALFEDAWNGLRESHRCSQHSYPKLKDCTWPVAVLTEAGR